MNCRKADVREIELKESKKCDKCNKKAIVFLAYGPHNYCQSHFINQFEKRFRRTIRQNNLILKKERIGIALSGGKDSTALAFLLQKYFKFNNELIAISIDEGMPGYRDKSLAFAKKTCKKLGIKHKIYSFKDYFGFNVKDAFKKLDSLDIGNACSICGTLRRRILNDSAVELKLDKLAIGHNLDDESQSIAMNLFENDLVRLSRMGAQVGSGNNDSFVPRIKPFQSTLENEIEYYCMLNNIDHYFGECCPHSSQVKRRFFRIKLAEFESKFPGTKYSILRSFESLKPILIKSFAKKISWNVCQECGGPTNSSNVCKTCEILNKLKKAKIIKKNKINKKFK